MFFAKAQYETVKLPYVCCMSNEDMYACTINLEAKGYVCGEMRYFFSSFIVGESNMRDIVTALKNAENKQADVILKIKKGNLKDFKFDLKSIAKELGDERFEKLELCGWGINSKPLCELDSQYKKIC